MIAEDSNMADVTILIDRMKADIENSDITQEDIQDVYQRIKNKQISLLTLIESLATALLDVNPSKRCKALSVLTRVVELLLPDHLGDKDLAVIADFFCSKLKDHHSLLPVALAGLQSLSFCQNLPDGLATLMVRSIFQEVHCQSQMQADRRKVYSILKHSLSYKIKEIQSLGQDFTFGFIQAVDQERDPRNLLIIFSCIPVIANFIKIEPFVEEFFEVFSCYFPIDFTVPSDDPFGVTREQLVTGLRQCMASSPLFAEHCLPLLHSKMESDLLSAKIDAWKTLESCCAVYSAIDLENWVQSFWTLARKELMISVNGDDLEHTVLDSLTAISKTFSSPSAVSDNATFLKIFREILNECKGHLCEPERRLMNPSLNILLALCAGNEGACLVITDESIPLMLEQYKVRKDAIPRQFILNTLNKIVHAGLYGFTQNVHDSGVFKWLESLFELYVDILSREENATLKSLSLQGLALFLPIKTQVFDWKKITQSVLGLLSCKQLEQEVMREIDSFFQKMATHNDELICDEVVPFLIREVENDDPSYEKALLTISHLPVPAKTQAEIVGRLLQILENPSSVHRVQISILNALSEICERLGKPFCEVDVFWRLHSWTLQNIRSNGLNSLGMVSSSSSLLRNVSSLIGATDATGIAHQLAESYLTDSLLVNCTPLVFSLESSMGSLNAILEGTTLKKLTEVLESLAVNDPTPQIRLSASRLVAALLNKSNEGPDFDLLVDTLVSKIDHEAQLKPINAISLFIWIVKGLLMRGYSKIDVMIKKLISYLDNESTKHAVAEGFSVILADTVECLNPKSHANIRFLYRQRFFQLTVPHLLSAYRQSSDPNPAFLAAVANQLAYISSGVLASHAADLIVMFIQCLAVDQDPNLVLSTINALTNLFSENIQCIISHIDTLIPKLLVLSNKGQNLEVRRSALKCLGLLSNSPNISILPLRPQVVRQLLACLNDKKRLVRREAALTRHKWIMLGQPGGTVLEQN